MSSHQSQSGSKSKSESKSERIRGIADIDPKYLPEWYKEMRKDKNLIIDDSIAKQAIEAALNAQLREKEDKEYAKRHEEELRKMAEYENQKKQREREERERRPKDYAKLAEQQLSMFLSGRRDRWSCCHMLKRAEFFGHAAKCPTYTGIDIERD